MKRLTLEDKRRHLHKFDADYVSPNTYKQVIDSHLEALDLIEHVRQRLLAAKERGNFLAYVREVDAALEMIG